VLVRPHHWIVGGELVQLGKLEFGVRDKSSPDGR
jgi:hypothetical protein